MYNRYIPNGASYIRIPEEDAPPPEPVPEPAPPPGPAPPETAPAGDKAGGLLSGLLKGLKLEKLDAGDLLLLLILLFLVLEGDDLEMVITLALIFLLGLDEPS